MPSAVLLISLLAAVWGARGEPPRQITTGAVIHFGGDPSPQYPKTNYDGVQGLQYFATAGTNHIPAIQQPVLVYPGSVLGAGPIIIPTQVGIQGVGGGSKGIPYYGYIVPSTPTPQPPPTPPSPPPPPPPPLLPLPLPVTPPPLHNNVDLTYDSLSSSSSQGGASYNPVYTTPAPYPTPQPILTSPPPMQATTYGPAKPVVLRPYLTTRHRGAFVLGPPHHHLTATKPLVGHYHHLIPVSPKHIHGGPSPAHLVKSKPHPYPIIYAPHNPQPLRTAPATLYDPPVRKPQSSPINAVSHPDITKAIFHPQPEDSYAAAAAALRNVQTHLPYTYGQGTANPPASYGFGAAPVLPQQYYVPIIPYNVPVLGTRQRSDNLDFLQTGEDVAVERSYQDTDDDDQENNLEEKLEEQSSPVLLYEYKGVRSPVRLYQKPETPLISMSSKQTEIHKEDVMDTGNVLSPESFSAGSSSNWMPINAPEGAVPARAYEIPAPDLSRGNHYSTDVVESTNRNHNIERSSQVSDYTVGHSSSAIGRVSAVPVVHGDRIISRTDSNMHQRNIYKGNSEEVVSAVVLVKQK